MKKDIFLAHNTSADKIMFSDKIGGFVCPSLAVIDSDSGFHPFGNITLIKNINNYNFKANPAYDSDIYSARYPAVFHNINKKKVNSIIRNLDSISKNLKVVDHNGKKLNGLKTYVNGLLYEMMNVEHYKHSIDQLKTLALNSLDIRILHAVNAGVEPVIVLKPVFNGLLKPIGAKTIMDIIDEMGDMPIDDRCLDIVYKHMYPIIKKEFDNKSNRLLLTVERGETEHPDKILELINYKKEEFEKIFSEGKFVGGLRIKENVFSAISNIRAGSLDISDGKVIEYLNKKLKIDSFYPEKTYAQSEKFYDFVFELMEECYKDSYFFNKKGKSVKLTAENMLKELSFGLKNQEKDCIDSPIQIKAELAKPMLGIDQIVKNISKITTRKNYKSGLDGVNKLFDEYVSGLRELQKNKLSFFDSEYIISEFTKEFISGKKDLKKEFGDDFDMRSEKFDHVVNKLRKIISVVGDLNVNYFEVKHKGVIKLSDFSAAIVPRCVSKKVVDKLVEAGLNIVEYDDKKIDINIKVDKSWLSAIKKVRGVSLMVDVEKNKAVESSLEL